MLPLLRSATTLRPMPPTIQGPGGRAPAALVACTLVACDGVQSTLAPAGRSAELVADIFWWSVAGSAIVWLAVIALGAWALLFPPVRGIGEGSANRLIIYGGAVFPTIVLGAYLAYGLHALPVLLDPAPPGSLRIAVSGEQWWWRVRYLLPDGEEITLANEIRLPVGEPVEFLLDSPDVIHSFWIPSLGGKVDMIPGRTNRLTLHPTRTGTFRGACAEFCGASHALMNFHVVVEERAAFDRWIEGQAAPARLPTDELGRRGQALFLGNGCGACHAVRGTIANGGIGPDLTHVGGRLSLGAGILPNGRADFVRWIASTAHLKPEVRMPSFGMLPPADLEAIAAFLDGLE